MTKINPKLTSSDLIPQKEKSEKSTASEKGSAEKIHKLEKKKDFDRPLKIKTEITDLHQAIDQIKSNKFDIAHKNHFKIEEKEGILRHPQFINIVEVNHFHEIEALRRDLMQILANDAKKKEIPHITSYDLSHLGLNTSVEVIGNKFIPLKKSEHKEIQSALFQMGHEVGMNHSHGLTFIIVEDHLFHDVIHELRHAAHEVLNAPPKHALDAENKNIKKKPFKRSSQTFKTTASSNKQSKEEIQALWKKEVSKILKKLVPTTKSHDKFETEKEERSRLLQKEIIAYGIEQYENLVKVVAKEEMNGALSNDRLNSIISKWENSLPPFFIRSINFSTQWKELKPKMIDELLAHFDRNH